VRWYLRLGRSSEIAFVRRKGRTAGGPTLAAYAVGERSGATRVAITVSKAVGNAVTRNLVRRRIRGALDGCTPPPSGLRLLLVAKPAAAGAPFAGIARDVVAALGSLGGPR
jgi:ribonuclease P protein component